MKGMIMGAESVRAILDGRKTRHSFPIKPQPQEQSEVEIGMWSQTSIDKHGMAYPKPEVWGMSFESFGFGHIGVCPRYKVGEIVYVKETWKVAENVTVNSVAPVLYKAECNSFALANIDNWKSPFSMPELASRIHLEITGIKAQRVQDITEEEAMAEGIEKPIEERCMLVYRDYSIKEEDNEGYNWFSTAKDSYSSLWDSINAKKGLPWESNPWVWVVSFKVVQGC